MSIAKSVSSRLRNCCNSYINLDFARNAAQVPSHRTGSRAGILVIIMYHAAGDVVDNCGSSEFCRVKFHPSGVGNVANHCRLVHNPHTYGNPSLWKLERPLVNTSDYVTDYLGWLRLVPSFTFLVQGITGRKVYPFPELSCGVVPPLVINLTARGRRSRHTPDELEQIRPINSPFPYFID